MGTLLRTNRYLAVAILTVALLAVMRGTPARASDRILKGYRHSAWTSDNGIGAVFNVQQSPDGYLWLTTSKGVLRFDGVRFEAVSEITNGAVRSSDIFSVFVSSSGGIWFVTRSAGFLLWKDEHVTAFPDRHCTPYGQTGGVIEDRDGSLWIEASTGLAHLRGSVCETIDAERGYPGGLPVAALIDHEGTVWVKAQSGALLFLPRGQSRFQLSQYVGGPTSSLAFLKEASDGSLWISDEQGIRKLSKAGGASSQPEHRKNASPFRDFTFAPDGSIWAVNAGGVRHFHEAKGLPLPLTSGSAVGESFTPEQGLSSDAVWNVLIDREGSVWVATNSGLDRLRRTALSTLSLPHVQEREFGVAAGDNGSVWVGNSSLPLTHVAGDGPDRSMVSFPQIRQTTTIRRDRNGTIWAAGEGDAHLWRTSGKGLLPVHYPGESVEPVVSLAVDRDDAPWLLTRGGTVYRSTHGTWSKQNEALGRRPGVLGAMAGDDAGDIWLAFSKNLVRWDGEKYDKAVFSDDALNISVGTMSIRGEHVWLGGRGGVVLFTHGRFYPAHWKDPDLPGGVSGIVESKTGDLWINSFSGVTHVPAAEVTRWIRAPASPISAERLDALDGLPGFSAERLPEPSIVESPEGRLWFATTRGVAWLDPARLDALRNRMPPTVVVSSIVVNGRRYLGGQDLALSKHTENVEINYTALSLAMPERVLFRYKLEGFDKDWQEAGTRRQAFYTSLPPGRYRFHVSASNNDGIWSETGATLGFTLPPAFYQTWWFIVLCVLAAFGLLWWMVRLRIRSITHQLQGRLAERLAERERIARELHDTLLQSLFGVMLRFQLAADRLPTNDPVREELHDALTQSDAVMQHGRNRVRDLRGSYTESASLHDAFALLSDQFQAIHKTQFRLTVEGRPRALDKLVQEEIFLIGREALVNAFTHSGAESIRIGLTYSPDAFHLSVCDDGCGIDEAVLDAGFRSDHWGLPGMYERAGKICGAMNVLRRMEGGTEVRLQVPAKAVYVVEALNGLRFLSFLRRSDRRTAVSAKS